MQQLEVKRLIGINITGDEVKAITFHKMNIVEGDAVKLSAIVDL